VKALSIVNDHPYGTECCCSGLRLAEALQGKGAEVELTDVQLSTRVTDRPYVLLGIVDVPGPDPAKGLTPHLVLLDDRRSVNLGHIARITRSRALSPAPADVLYHDGSVLKQLLCNERRLSARFVAAQSRRLPGELLRERTTTTTALPRKDQPEGPPERP
jgi:hypothetical protein